MKVAAGLGGVKRKAILLAKAYTLTHTITNEEDPMARVIAAEILVPAGVAQVWRAWTTPAGIQTFFAPDCRVELRAGGPYEIYFNPEAEEGARGSEGMRVLAFQTEKMLSFTWNAPPHLAAVRRQMTHVTLRLYANGPGETRVTLRHDGWGIGGQWDQAYAYFNRVWREVVLPRLQQRFRQGPIDWKAL